MSTVFILDPNSAPPAGGGTAPAGFLSAWTNFTTGFCGSQAGYARLDQPTNFTQQSSGFASAASNSSSGCFQFLTLPLQAISFSASTIWTIGFGISCSSATSNNGRLRIEIVKPDGTLRAEINTQGGTQVGTARTTTAETTCYTASFTVNGGAQSVLTGDRLAIEIGTDCNGAIATCPAYAGGNTNIFSDQASTSSVIAVCVCPLNLSFLGVYGDLFPVPIGPNPVYRY